MEVKDRLLTALRKIPPMMWLMIVTLAVLLLVGRIWFDQLMAYHENYRNLGLIFVALLGAPLLVWRAFIADTQSKAAKTQAEAEYKQALTAEANHTASTYTQAIEQLAATTSNGEPALELRLGGIYALEKIAQSNAHYHPQIMEVLSAYLRMHSPATHIWQEYGDTPDIPPLRIDIQAIMNVIGRRYVEFDTQPIDLSGLALDGLQLRDANLTNTILSTSSLYRSFLFGCNLSCVNLDHSLLSHSNFVNVDLTSSSLKQAWMQDSHLSQVRLVNADLRQAKMMHSKIENDSDLSGARLEHANLTSALIFGANMESASLYKALLDEADLLAVRLSSAKLHRTSLVGTNFAAGTDLRGAWLNNVDFSDAETFEAVLDDRTAKRISELRLKPIGTQSRIKRRAMPPPQQPASE